MVATGGVSSTSQVQLAGVGSTLVRTSRARTNSVWLPSPTLKFSVLSDVGVQAPPSSDHSNAAVATVEDPPPNVKDVARERVRCGGAFNNVVSGSGDVASEIAPAAFRNPPLATLPDRLVNWVAPCISSAFTSATEAEGTADQINAATPAT